MKKLLFAAMLLIGACAISTSCQKEEELTFGKDYLIGSWELYQIEYLKEDGTVHTSEPQDNVLTFYEDGSLDIKNNPAPCVYSVDGMEMKVNQKDYAESDCECYAIVSFTKDEFSMREIHPIGVKAYYGDSILYCRRLK